jgi:hypothetical protein
MEDALATEDVIWLNMPDVIWFEAAFPTPALVARITRHTACRTPAPIAGRQIHQQRNPRPNLTGQGYFVAAMFYVPVGLRTVSHGDNAYIPGAPLTVMGWLTS